MNIIVTGTSGNIGLATAEKFLKKGHCVYGFDKEESKIQSKLYTHFILDINESDDYPDLENIDIVVNNAGTQNATGKFCDIDNNLISIIKITKKYILNNKNIKAVVNIASVSAHNGCEFGEYCASKGGVLSYSKWTAKEIAKYGAVCNSLSFGGVLSTLNDPVLNDEKCWSEIMKQTPLKKWMTTEECAEWIYFFTVKNKSCTAQDLIIDNGEFYNHHFVWPKD